jgi:4'-phosphopantetheinyl transferase
MFVQAQQLLPGWLSDSEQQRLTGLSSARQQMFLACRYALRLLLAESAEQLEKWRLSSHSGHAPRVEHGHECNAPAPMLSLSHSNGVLVCAKAPVAVGVDIEVQRPSRFRDVLAIAEFACSQVERAWLAELTPDEQQHGILQLWCLKEAYFKCIGSGINFAHISEMSWSQASGNCTVADGTVNIAYARLWKGVNSEGDNVYLALCTQDHPLPAVSPHIDEECLDLAWQEIAEWQLWIPDYSVVHKVADSF